MRKVALLFSLTLIFCLVLGYPGGHALAAPIVSFQPAVNYPVGTNPEGVGIGDFNGDSKPDLVTANWIGNNVSVLINNGDGTFQSAVNYNVGSGPEKVSFGDFNSDGKLDLVTANYGSSNISILMNKGDGTFESMANYAVSGFPKSVAVGDVNGDGKHDLAVASGSNYFYWIHVLINNGDGTFRSALRYNLENSDNPLRVVIEDLNGDSKPDLVTESYWRANVAVLMNKGDGTFESAVNYATLSGSRDLAVEDFNSDGRPDLAVATQGQIVSILMNKGDGTFQSGVGYPVGHDPRSLMAGDFNGDGKPDLATSSTSDSNVYVLINSGDGTFRSPEKVVVGALIWSMAAGDCNDDGKLDLTVTTGYTNTVSVLINTTVYPDPVNPSADTFSPTSMLTLSGTAGNDGWYVSDVQAALTAVDNPGGSGVAKTEYSFDGIDWITYTGPFNITDEGQTTVYYRSTDKADNTEAAKEQVIKIDKTVPQISINLPAEGDQYYLGQQIITGWNATDTLSGLESATGTTPAESLLDTTSVGMRTYTVTAIDQAGNEVSKTVSYQVTYVFGGIVQHLDGKTCKLGSNVPVKFWLKDAEGKYVPGASTGLSVAKLTDGSAPEALPAVSTNRSAEVSLFRYDITENHYIFNLNTTGLSTGLWQLRIVLDDGIMHTGTINLE